MGRRRVGRFLGQEGGSVISGWNAPNRLVIGRNVKPGQKIQLAEFGINGPISNPPTNFLWVRYAKLDFYKGSALPNVPLAITPSEVNVEIDRKDPAIDTIVGPNPKIYKLAEGFKFTEGPIWVRDGRYLLFSDPNNNTIYKYTSDGNLSVFREKSGYDGADIAEYTQPGSNGLTLDLQGRLTINQHGNRRVIRLEKDGRITVLGGSLPGQAAQQSQRPRLPLRWHPFLHRSSFRSSRVLRRPPQETPLQRSLLPPSRRAQTGQQRSQRPEWARLLARREVPVRRQLGPEKGSHHALRGSPRRDTAGRSSVL